MAKKKEKQETTPEVVVENVEEQKVEEAPVVEQKKWEGHPSRDFHTPVQ